MFLKVWKCQHGKKTSIFRDIFTDLLPKLEYIMCTKGLVNVSGPHWHGFIVTFLVILWILWTPVDFSLLDLSMCDFFLWIFWKISVVARLMRLASTSKNIKIQARTIIFFYDIKVGCIWNVLSIWNIPVRSYFVVEKYVWSWTFVGSCKGLLAILANRQTSFHWNSAVENLLGTKFIPACRE